MFQILSLLFYLEIVEYNFCNLNKNTKRNILLRENEANLLREETVESDIEVSPGLIVKDIKLKELDNLRADDETYN